MNKMIIVSKTYATTTHESVENGDFEETGFVYQDEILTFHELIKEINSEHYCHLSSYPCNDPTNIWITCESFTSNYKTGEEKEYSLHFTAKNPKDWKYWKKALKYCGVIK
jgi:hypothetical protein